MGFFFLNGGRIITAENVERGDAHTTYDDKLSKQQKEICDFV